LVNQKPHPSAGGELHINQTSTWCAVGNVFLAANLVVERMKEGGTIAK